MKYGLFFGMMTAAMCLQLPALAQDAVPEEGQLWGLSPPVAPSAVPSAAKAAIEEDDPVAVFAASNQGPGEDGEASQALLADGESLTPPPAPTWRENATRLYFDSATKLAWRNELGDYLPTPVASVLLRDTADVVTVRIPVPPMNDFYIRSTSAAHAEYSSREASTSSQRPVLVANGRTYNATRDTVMTTTSLRPQGTAPTIRDRTGMLIAFDGYTPRAGDRVELKLTTTKIWGDHQVAVYKPDVRYELSAIPDVHSDPTVVRDLRSDSMQRSASTIVSGGVVTSTISGSSLTWFNQRWTLPSADEYYMATVIKLGSNWPDRGGKLPGLSNTGYESNSGGVSRIIGGVDCSNSGWGGRPANGCRWSARTGWYGRSGDYTGLASYFYAVHPSGTWGVGESFPMPAPVGKWFALVQRVRINTPGRTDGMLSYWLCQDSGCYPQYHRNDIAWRTADLPEAKLNEVWNNVYCGGTSCGGSLPPTAASLKRMTITRGLPDLVALRAEVRALNGL